MLGEQEAAGIVEWLKRKAGPSLVLLEEVDAVAGFVNLHNVAVVGFFQVSDILFPPFEAATGKTHLLFHISPLFTC